MKKVPNKIKDKLSAGKGWEREEGTEKQEAGGGGGRRRQTKGLGLMMHGCVRSEVFTTLNVWVWSFVCTKRTTGERFLCSFPLPCNVPRSVLVRVFLFVSWMPRVFCHLLGKFCRFLLLSARKRRTLEKEEDPRTGGLDSLWCTNNESFFLNEKTSVAF
jgi:hypothetical protein